MATRPDAFAKLVAAILILLRLVSRLDGDDDARRGVLAFIADRSAAERDVTDLDALTRLVTVESLVLGEHPPPLKTLTTDLVRVCTERSATGVVARPSRFYREDRFLDSGFRAAFRDGSDQVRHATWALKMFSAYGSTDVVERSLALRDLGPDEASDRKLNEAARALAKELVTLRPAQWSAAFRCHFGVVRVACIGDSITQGARVAGRERNHYPAQLGWMLGDGYDVRNFGAGGATLLRAADRPYAKTPAFRKAVAFRPDVAVVILGTNDTCGGKRGCWDHEQHLERDARWMVDRLVEANRRVRVLLCTPTPILAEAPGLEPARRQDLRARAPRLERIGRSLRTVAAERRHASFVDLRGALAARHVVDGVHTTPFGAEVIARHLFGVIDVLAAAKNPAVRPRPSAEYRGHAAGWGGGTWWDQVDAMSRLAREHRDVQVVLLGDSITQGLTGSKQRMATASGRRAVDEALGKWKTVSLGISGDRTEHILWRIRHGALSVLEPKVVVLNVGVNNVYAGGHSGAQTAEGVVAVVKLLREREPQARVLLCGPFPAGPAPDDPRRRALDRVHERIAGLASDRVSYLDLRGMFLDDAGRPTNKMSRDHIHITAAGQRAWMQAIAPVVGELMEQ